MHGPIEWLRLTAMQKTILELEHVSEGIDCEGIDIILNDYVVGFYDASRVAEVDC